LKKSKLGTPSDDKKEEKKPTPSKPVGQPLPVYGKNWTNKPAEQPVISESMNDKKEAPPIAKKSSTKFKFNVDASEFKPNPDAAEFIPVSSSNIDEIGCCERTTSCSNSLFRRKENHNWSFI
jgi:hypothetical protein